ncbi:disulfide oxidoreductase [Bacillus bombysepticus]|uniref:disulfide oxidoreductase n=1 Tax=Bacillus bombysepticus TaxID=658666 RepID=UPI00301604D4
MKTKISFILAWITSVIAMSGSLYFSEVMKFIPCSFCWYQRILMYPLTWILGYAAWKRDTRIIPYVLPLTILGMFFSGLHYLQQQFLIFEPTCSVSYIPCAGKYIEWFGFVTIPLLSFIAFSIISFSLIYIKKQNNK